MTTVQTPGGILPGMKPKRILALGLDMARLFFSSEIQHAFLSSSSVQRCLYALVVYNLIFTTVLGIPYYFCKIHSHFPSSFQVKEFERWAFKEIPNTRTQRKKDGSVLMCIRAVGFLELTKVTIT